MQQCNDDGDDDDDDNNNNQISKAPYKNVTGDLVTYRTTVNCHRVEYRRFIIYD